MPAGTSVGDLYLRLGLNLSDLETGFVTASQTVAANISRLNRESNLIRIRSEIDIAGLDETADAERILQIRTDALNRQMQIQRDRIRILDAEYQNLVQSQGANSTAAQRATVRLERERLALANLDRELRNLNDSSNQQSTGILDELNDALPQMPTKLQAVEMAFGAMTAGIGAATASVKELMTNFRELQKQSYELNMPFEETRDFLREMKLAGGDIGDIEGFIRGISDAYVKGEYDDPEFIALRKYGAEITDATGRLKNFKDLTEEIYRAWEKADAAGEGIEFLQLTGGEMGVRDIIQYFQRLKEAREDAAKIYEAKIDDKQLHELDRVLGRVEEQSIELKNAIGDIFTPAAQAAGEKFFQMLHDGTAFLVESKDEIQTFGRVAIGVFEEINSLLPSGQFSTILEDSKAIYDELKKNQESFKPSDEMKKYLDAQTAANPISVLKNAFSESDVVKNAIEKQKEFNGEIQGTTKSWADFRKEVEKSDKVLNDKNPLNQYALKRIQEFRDELEDLQIELNFDDNDYLKKLAELDLWRDRESIYKNFVSEDEAKAIDELYEARKRLIDLERDNNLAEIRKSVDAEFKSSIDARIDKINEEKEAWVSAGMDAAEAMELTQKRIDKAMGDAAKDFEREVDRIKGSVQTLDDEIYELEHSQYQNDLRKLQEKYMERAQEYQEAGIMPLMKDKLDYWYSLEENKLKQRAKKDKDYRKSPEGAMERGGNGITVISGDQIIDDGLIQSRQKEIGLLADENQIRAQLLQKQRQELSGDTWAMLAQKVQRITLPQQQEQTSGIQVIEGDKVVEMPEVPTGYLQNFNTALQQTTAGIEQFAMPKELVTPEISAEPLQEFNTALGKVNLEMEKFNPLATLGNAEKALTERLNQVALDFPTDYFKNLADGAQSVSEMQMRLTDSTISLIDAQENLRRALLNLPVDKSQMPTNLSTDGLRQLSTQNSINNQDLLARKTHELERLPTSQNKDKGLNFGFDMDTAGTVLGLGALLAGIGGAPITAPIAAGITALSALGGLAKGTYDNSTAPNSIPENIPDLTQIITPLTSIDGNVQSVLQDLQSQQETTISMETIVTPLNNIADITSNILSAMGNAKQPDITVSPNIKVDLGGAYVFDEKMKSTLVDDITDKIVTSIIEAVKSETSNRNFAYSA